MTKSDIQSIIGAKTVSFNSLFAKATGSVTAAVFLSQAVFWQEKAKFKNSLETLEIDGEEYFSKTGAEWYEETGLSAEQQKTARKPLVASGILKEKRAGLPAKMYFRIDIEALVYGISGYLNKGVTVSGFSGNRKPENPRTGSGKFRKQEAGKPANITNIESLESLESGGGEATAPAENSNLTLKEETKPQTNGAAPPSTLIEVHDPETPGATIFDAVPSVPSPEFGRVNVEAEVNRLRTDAMAKETFSLVRKIPAAKYDDYLTAFSSEISTTGETYWKTSDFRRHFLNWSEKRYMIEKDRTPAVQRSSIAGLRRL